MGSSMVPTLRDGDWRLVNRWWPRLIGIERGDLVLVQDPTCRTKVIKRIIGLPGDVLEMREDGVYVNRRKLEEPYLAPGIYTWSRRHGTRPVSVGAGRYFVMGDNRTVSLDSRWYGSVRESSILGIVTY
jgi:signal peptidase I